MPLRPLAGLWLAEPTGDLIAFARRAPELAAHVPTGDDAAARVALAIAWLDLVSRQVPPHESVFVDPSAMLEAPATARLRATLAGLGWSPPPGLRVPAVDQLGVELWALAELVERGHAAGAAAVLTDHLLPWLPVFADAVAHADVHPLYAALAPATADAVLTLADGLPPDVLPSTAADALPALPPRPRYRPNEHGDGVPLGADGDAADGRNGADGRDGAVGRDGADTRLGDVLDALLIPRDAGLYLGRADLARCAKALDLPLGLGDRRAMLRGLFEAAGRHNAVDALLAALDARWSAADTAYAHVARDHPAWTAYASAWRARLDATRGRIAAWRASAA